MNKFLDMLVDMWIDDPFGLLFKKNLKWSADYSYEGVTDFYADDDFEDALKAVLPEGEDWPEGTIRITVEYIEDGRI
jgi:hypothetical protein